LRESLPETVAQLRADLESFCRAGKAEAHRSRALTALARRVHALSSNASICELGQVALLIEALEALLRKMDNPENQTESARRTVNSVLECLLQMHRNGFPTGAVLPRVDILVVDDEVISRKAVLHALRRVKLPALTTADPTAAMAMLVENKFDLIVLDVQMGGMDGFELCTRLRKLGLHAKTPVIFITCHDDFASKAASVTSGANDFIAKPFCPMELAAKALLYVIKAQIPGP
jgi:CheY-like chemotaxis protein